MKYVVLILIIIFILLLLHCYEKFNTTIFPEVHVILLWNTDKSKKQRALNILKKYTVEVINIEDIHLHGKRINLNSGGIDIDNPFTLIIIKDLNPNYTLKQTYDGEMMVNKNLFDIKSDIRGDYKNYKIAHGSFNTEESRHILEKLDRYQYWKENRNTFLSFNDLFENLKNVNYVVDRSFEDIGNSTDIDVLTDDYYKFKNIIGGINDSNNKIENKGFNIQNKCMINNKNIPFDIRYTGDNYYPSQWQEDILQRKQLYNNNIFIPSDLDQLWMLYYHTKIQHPGRENTKHQKKIGELSKKLNITPNKENFEKFMEKNKYSIAQPLDKNVSIIENFELKENFENIKGSGNAEYVRKVNNNYVKRYKNPLGYLSEKNSYIRLHNEPHFPKLLDYDDKNFTLILENVGNPITRYIPDWEKQINEIKDSLQKHNIIHNDIIIRNFLEKDGIIYLIDFEYAEDKNNLWKTLDNSTVLGCKYLPPLGGEYDIETYLQNNNCSIVRDRPHK